MLEIKNLNIEANGQKILNGVNLSFEKGKVYALLGPNGSGKSTLARSIIGFPGYKVAKGDILWKGESILDLPIYKRANLGIVYAFQNPPSIPGVNLEKFICKICLRPECKCEVAREDREVHECHNSVIMDFKELGIDYLLSRDLNVDFSGGEQKRSELCQVIALNPEFAILDEPDSGLDFDSFKLVIKALKKIQDTKKVTLLIITHNRLVLEYLQVDRVDILSNGRNAYSGDMSIVPLIAEKGYESFKERTGGNT